MRIIDLMYETVAAQASDLHLTVGTPPNIRINGELRWLRNSVLDAKDVLALISQIISPEQRELVERNGELDLSFSLKDTSRFRINIYKQRGNFGAALRVINFRIPTMEELGLPPVIETLARKTKGLVLVTGVTGSGKTTTLACMINQINRERRAHIITLEDPIEYTYEHKKSMINQREIGRDAVSFASGLRAALRQDPDVILVGEMRDLDTISTAVIAAETGHLVLSTLHTLGAAKTIDRIVNVYPAHQIQQIKMQIASVLEGIVSQQLLLTADGSARIPAIEVMLATNAIRNLIREGKTHQIQSMIQTSSKLGMQTMDDALLELYDSGLITREDLFDYATEPDLLNNLLAQRL